MIRSVAVVQAAFGVALACLSMSCTAPAPAPAAVPAPADSPVVPKVQRLVMAAPFTLAVDTNDTGAMVESDLWILRPMYESLIGVDPATGKGYPMLATGWALEPDGKSFRFKLRNGVQFHQGRGEFTGKDLVAMAASRVRDEFQHGIANYWRAVLEKVEVVNDYEVVYRLKSPDGNFIFPYISDQSGSMQVWSKADFDKTGYPTMQSGPLAGTGPYQYVARAQSQFLRYERAPTKHWRTTPDFPEFEFRWIKEPSTRLAALLAGEVQVTTLPEDLLAEAQKQGQQVTRGKVPAARTFLTFMCCFLNNVQDPSQGYMFPTSPLADPRVRRALSKAIDRAPLNKAFFGGKADLLYLQSFDPTRLGWNPEWEKRFAEKYGYDQAKARALLAEAGYTAGNPLKTNLFLSDASGVAASGDLIEAIAAQWRAAGVDVTLVPMDPTQIATGSRTFKFSNHIQLRGTSADLWVGAINFGSRRSVRGGGVELPEYEPFIDEIARTPDEKKQDELWRKTGEIRYNAYHTAPLFRLPVEATFNPKVVSEWTLPGSLSGNWTHVEYIKAAR